MWGLIFANIPELSLGLAYTYVVWQVTRWTHKKWPLQWLSKGKMNDE